MEFATYWALFLGLSAVKTRGSDQPSIGITE